MDPLTIGLIAFAVVALGGALLKGAFSIVRSCLGIIVLICVLIWLIPKVVGG